MTKSEFIKLYNDCYQSELQAALPRIEEQLKKCDNGNGKIDTTQFGVIFFTEALKSNLQITSKVLSSLLEFDD
ncbi:MAG: hypothetical protein LUD81_02895 [Clostridiales bacterium]|nr:hypothetical protein [Clostridiales bacterium]